jgi:hypothetical protein
MTVHGILGLAEARRTVVRFLFLATAGLAIPAAMFVAPVTASADSTIFDRSIRESFGHRYCIGSDTTDLFAAVVERDCPGRKWNADPLGNSQWLLELHADTSKCIAAADNGFDVVLHACGDGGVVWIRERTGSGHDRWRNRLTDKYLTGQNQTGSQFLLFCLGCLSGGLQQFDFV